MRLPLPATMLSGAYANTKTLCVVPTSCGFGWICALTFALVGVTLAMTVIGKLGDGAMPLAVNVPTTAKVSP